MQTCKPLLVLFVFSGLFLTKTTAKAQVSCASIPATIPREQVDAYLPCALTARQNRDYTRANQYFERLSQAMPENENLVVEWATSLAWGKSYAQALAILNRLLQKSPQHLGALSLRGWVWTWSGELRAAREQFETLLPLLPIAAHLGLAFLDRIEYEFPDARAHYAAVLNLDPANLEAKKGLEGLKNAAKTDLTLATGRIEVVEGREVVQQTVEAIHHLNAQYSVTGTFFSNRNVENTAIHWEGGRLGLIRRISPSFTMGLTVFGTKGEIEYRYGLAVDGTYRLSDLWTILTTIRPMRNHNQAFEWILGSGLLVQPRARTYALSQCFLEQLEAQPMALTCTAATRLTPIEQFSIQPGAVWHKKLHTGQAGIFGMNIGLSYQFTDRFLGGLSFGLGQQEKQQIGVLVRVRR